MGENGSGKKMLWSQEGRWKMLPNTGTLLRIDEFELWAKESKIG